MTDIDEMRQQLDLLNNEGLIAILRAHDTEQWRSEAFDLAVAILSERGVSPDRYSDETVSEKNAMDETAGGDLTTVAEYFKYIDAETDRLALEAKGLKTWILNEENPLMVGIPMGVRLQVHADDLSTAMEVLKSQPVPSSDLPDGIAEPPCPKCGSRHVTETAELIKDLAADSMTSWLYICASCGNKWSEP
jgi:DNA-directed RNA polymerase subunit M/transcription elongation factor TFIIS